MKSTTQKKENALYVCPSLPLAWLVRLAGELWIVPAQANGWNDRSAYRGHAPETAGYAEATPISAMGCGIPWPA